MLRNYKLVKNNSYRDLIKMIKKDEDEIKKEIYFHDDDLIKIISSCGNEICLTYENPINSSFNLNIKYSKIVKEYRVYSYNKKEYELIKNKEYKFQIPITELIKYFYNRNDIQKMYPKGSKINDYEQYKKNEKINNLIKKIINSGAQKLNYNNWLSWYDTVKYLKDGKKVEKDISHLDEFCSCVENFSASHHEEINAITFDNVMEFKDADKILNYFLFGNQYLIDQMNKKAETLIKFSYPKSIPEILKDKYEDDGDEISYHMYHKLIKSKDHNYDLYIKSLNEINDHSILSFSALKDTYMDQFDFRHDYIRIKMMYEQYGFFLRVSKIKNKIKNCDNKNVVEIGTEFASIDGKKFYGGNRHSWYNNPREKTEIKKKNRHLNLMINDFPVN